MLIFPHHFPSDEPAARLELNPTNPYRWNGFVVQILAARVFSAPPVHTFDMPPTVPPETKSYFVLNLRATNDNAEDVLFRSALGAVLLVQTTQAPADLSFSTEIGDFYKGLLSGAVEEGLVVFPLPLSADETSAARKARYVASSPMNVQGDLQFGPDVDFKLRWT